MFKGLEMKTFWTCHKNDTQTSEILWKYVIDLMHDECNYVFVYTSRIYFKIFIIL